MIHYNITTKTRIALSGGYAELVPSGRVVEAGFTDPVIAGSVQLTEKFFLIENISVPAGKESIGEQRMNVGSGIVMQFFSSPKQSLQFLFKINFLQIEQYNWQKKKHESAFIRSPYNALYYRRTFADITLFFNLILDGIRNNNYISFGINENCTCIKYFYPSISVGYNLDTLYYVCTLSMRF
ncbi:MAG TPA: hypothetical protein PLP19_04495 [bacterium]|nr:hypothetical protein [bacterium]HPN42730.1 hypothetical protein [bacterium]